MTSVPHFYKFQSSIVRTKVIVFKSTNDYTWQSNSPKLEYLMGHTKEMDSRDDHYLCAGHIV